MRSLCDIRAKIRLAVSLFPFLTVGYGVSKRCAINIPNSLHEQTVRRKLHQERIFYPAWGTKIMCLNQKTAPDSLLANKTIIPANLHLSKCILIYWHIERKMSSENEKIEVTIWNLDSNVYYMCNANLPQCIRENIYASLTAVELDGEKHLVMKWPVGREMERNISNMLSSLSWMEERLTPAADGPVPTHLRQHN